MKQGSEAVTCDGIQNPFLPNIPFRTPDWFSPKKLANPAFAEETRARRWASHFRASSLRPVLCSAVLRPAAVARLSLLTVRRGNLCSRVC